MKLNKDIVKNKKAKAIIKDKVRDNFIGKRA